MTSQLKPKPKTKKLKDSARTSGFGFDKKRDDDDRKPIKKKAKEVTLKFMDMLDSELERFSNNEEDRRDFLDSMNYNLGGLMSCIYDVSGQFERKGKQLPNWLTIKEDFGSGESIRFPLLDHHPLDHFEQRKNSKGEAEYISQPYGLSYGWL